MAKWAHNNVMDKGLEWLESFVERMVLTSGSPATPTYAEVAAISLADILIDETDVTIADGDVSGRKATIAQQLAVDVDAPGDGDHVCLVDDTNTTLMFITSLTSVKEGLEAGDKVDFPAWDIELRDPQ